jgi:hypothetical protein
VLWQVVPLPAYPAFRKAAYKPWHPKNAEEPLSEWDPSEYPVASRVLDSSIVLGSERNPLFVQEADLMDRYVEALGKVLQNLDEVLARPFEPVPLR